MTTFKLSTDRRAQLKDITSQVEAAVRESGAESGYAIVYNPHTTAGLTIQENADPDVPHDLLWKLERLVAKDENGFRHGEGNSDSHIKASLVGSSVTVLIENGGLVLGTWQGIFFAEFDGPRSRQVHVKVVEG
jgi:secondary thiamine-phosphate synthase enzyme